MNEQKNKELKNFSVKEVGEWLSKEGVGYSNLFMEKGVTGNILVGLNYDELKEIGVDSVADRTKILARIIFGQRYFDVRRASREPEFLNNSRPKSPTTELQNSPKAPANNTGPSKAESKVDKSRVDTKLRSNSQLRGDIHLRSGDTQSSSINGSNLSRPSISTSTSCSFSGSNHACSKTTKESFKSSQESYARYIPTFSPLNEYSSLSYSKEPERTRANSENDILPKEKRAEPTLIINNNTRLQVPSRSDSLSPVMPKGIDELPKIQKIESSLVMLGILKYAASKLQGEKSPSFDKLSPKSSQNSLANTPDRKMSAPALSPNSEPQDNLRSNNSRLYSSPGTTKSTLGTTKSSPDVIKSSLDVIKSSPNVTKNSQDVTKNSPDITKSSSGTTKSSKESSYDGINKHINTHIIEDYENLASDPGLGGLNESNFSEDVHLSAYMSSDWKEYIGERPPDELIVDRLEHFFPGIENDELYTEQATEETQNRDPPTSGSIEYYRNKNNFANRKSVIRTRAQSAIINKRMSRARNTVLGGARISERTSSMAAYKKHPINVDMDNAKLRIHQSMLLSRTKNNAGSKLNAQNVYPLVPEAPYKNENTTFGSMLENYELEAQESNLENANSVSPANISPANVSSGSASGNVPGSASGDIPGSASGDISQGDALGSVVPNAANSKDLAKRESYSMMKTYECVSKRDTIISSRFTNAANVSVAFKWKLGKVIGKGAFSTVYIGLNLATGTLMAVKQVGLGRLNVPEAKRRRQEKSIKQEIEFLKELQHDHIVSYYGCASVDGTFNVFLEYVSGGSISSCLARYGSFVDECAKCFTAQILFGLEYLHSVNIIHRDIKGANILIDSEGVAKISDFGISKRNQYNQAYHRVTRMSMQGTVPWMAPEVTRGKGYSAKVDIWSLGCLVLEMLTNRNPWYMVEGNVIYLLGKGKAPPIPSTLSPEANKLLKSCFHINPELRPTATELLNQKNGYPNTKNPMLFDFKAWAAEARRSRS